MIVQSRKLSDAIETESIEMFVPSGPAGYSLTRMTASVCTSVPLVFPTRSAVEKVSVGGPPGGSDLVLITQEHCGTRTWRSVTTRTLWTVVTDPGLTAQPNLQLPPPPLRKLRQDPSPLIR